MKFKYLSKYFPPPQFLKPPRIGVSFSDTSIKAISFESKSTGPHFKSAIISIEKGAVVAGSIVNMEEVVKRLSIIKKSFVLPFVFFTVPDELSYVFSASIPTSGGDLTEAIAFVIEENVPLPLNETVFDFVPTQIVPSESGYDASVVVTACVKKEMERFLEAFYKAGFEPVGCIPESQAIAGAVVPKNFLGTFCVVHAREKRIGIHLIKNKTVYFSTIRTISDGDYKKEFLDEYDKFLEYCSKYDVNQNQPIKAIFVCGEFVDAQKIVEAITESSTPVKNIKLSNVWANVFEIDKYSPDIPFEKSLSFAGAIGSALLDIN
ncbi:MAG: pilus assembly protein PilM [Candidatus Zambryskibacteria bacterium]